MWSPFPFSNTTILIVFLVLFGFHMLFVSRSRLFIDMIAVYVGIALVWIGPRFISYLADLFTIYPFARVVFFFGIVALFHIVLWHSNLRDPSSLIRPLSTVTSLVYRLSVVGLFLTTIVYLTPEAFRGTISGWVGLLFSSYVGLLSWLILPACLGFAYRFHAKNGWF